jgi:hypothetical protein
MPEDDPTSTANCASIFTGISGEATKFTLETAWRHPETGIPVPAVFNINSDVLIESFKSEGAQEMRTLSLTYTSISQAIGFQRFEGTVGENKIYIMLERGMVVKGKIVGGPAKGQTFVGAGTWTRA